LNSTEPNRKVKNIQLINHKTNDKTVIIKATIPNPRIYKSSYTAFTFLAAFTFKNVFIGLAYSTTFALMTINNFLTDRLSLLLNSQPVENADLRRWQVKKIFDKR
jgi:hypothetical protein